MSPNKPQRLGVSLTGVINVGDAADGFLVGTETFTGTGIGSIGSGNGTRVGASVTGEIGTTIGAVVANGSDSGTDTGIVFTGAGAGWKLGS